jgi:hypothetical protein
MENHKFVKNLVIAALIAVVCLATLKNGKAKKKINPDDIYYEQRYVNGVWMWHVYYEDDEFAYEASDVVLNDAVATLVEMVNI